MRQNVFYCCLEFRLHVSKNEKKIKVDKYETGWDAVKSEFNLVQW